MGCENKEAAALVKKIAGLHAAISKLPSLSPSPEADALFTALVAVCAPPSAAVDVAALGPRARRMRADLVRLCADAEARLEARCSDALAALDAPLDHLRIFPYHDNYVCLGELEHALLSRHALDHLAVPARVAFLGSGSLPLCALLLAARTWLVQKMLFLLWRRLMVQLMLPRTKALDKVPFEKFGETILPTTRGGDRMTVDKAKHDSSD